MNPNWYNAVCGYCGLRLRAVIKDDADGEVGIPYTENWKDAVLWESLSKKHSHQGRKPKAYWKPNGQTYQRKIEDVR